MTHHNSNHISIVFVHLLLKPAVKRGAASLQVVTSRFPVDDVWCFDPPSLHLPQVFTARG